MKCIKKIPQFLMCRDKHKIWGVNIIIKMFGRGKAKI